MDLGIFEASLSTAGLDKVLAAELAVAQDFILELEGQGGRKEKKVSCLQRVGIQSCSLKVKLDIKPIRAKIYNMPP